MISYFISTSLPNDTPLTAHELILAAVTARTYATAAQKADAIRRISAGGPAGEIFVRPAADVYMMDAYKKVTNGVCDTTSPLVAGDFTALPGGGIVLGADISRRVGNGADLKHRVFFQASGGAVRVDFEIGIH